MLIQAGADLDADHGCDRSDFKVWFGDPDNETVSLSHGFGGGDFKHSQHVVNHCFYRDA